MGRGTPLRWNRVKRRWAHGTIWFNVLIRFVASSRTIIMELNSERGLELIWDRIKVIGFGVGVVGGVEAGDGGIDVVGKSCGMIGIKSKTCTDGSAGPPPTR